MNPSPKSTFAVYKVETGDITHIASLEFMADKLAKDNTEITGSLYAVVKAMIVPEAPAKE